MSTLTSLLLAVTAIVTFLGLRNPSVLSRYSFKPDRILGEKQWDRLISSGFLHVDWMHFLMNAVSFYFFADTLERVYGGPALCVIYLGSIVGGNLLALYFHRHHFYTAVGASGGVCGLIFASLFLLPGMQISVFPGLLSVPGWLYAIAFLLGSYYGMRSLADNIGHDAHFGGAIVGLLIALALYPALVLVQPMFLALVLGLSGLLLWYLVRRPFMQGLEFPVFGPEAPKAGRRYKDYEDTRRAKESRAEIDRILDKIARQGIASLTAAERTKLDAYAKSQRRD